MKTESDAADFLDRYRKRIYSIIHSGYNLGDDSKPIPASQPSVIDGRAYRSKTVYGAVDSYHWINSAGRACCEERPSYFPSPVHLQNSDYMADYSVDVGAAIRRWQDEGSIINLNQHPEYAREIKKYGHCELKLTIEPS